MQGQVMGPTEFAREFGVSRETIQDLQRYVELLGSWNARINLIGQSTRNEIWSRHLADSAQLFRMAPPDTTTWIDLGAGAGLPGLPVALIAAELAPHIQVTLVESDRRKAAFLQMAVRELRLAVAIETKRIEVLRETPYDVVSARALAPLDRLCVLAYRFKGPRTTFLFPKGERLDYELTQASASWHIHADRIPSRTHPGATILRILELEPRT